MEFGLTHPRVNEQGDHFTTLFNGDLINKDDREQFCSVLFKLLPVLIYLLRLCARQVVGGYSWKHEMKREGFCKSLNMIMMQSIPVLEIKWYATTFLILDSKMRMIQRVVELIGSRSTSNWLRFHPYHPKIECVKNESNEVVGYKSFMIPFGRRTDLESGTHFKNCLRNVCDEVKWCHAHNLIHNDIRWATICTLDND